uniref:PID domain-containing protein n=2 Tax=Bactrocera latifrons TaxID=174628 RepID=A0A0K8UX47_BACLA
MVTCSMVDTVPISKMNTAHSRKPLSSNSSGFRLLDADHLETASSVSKNSVYKLKIDLMFDDTRSLRSNRLDDTRGSHRTRSIIMYGRSELASTGQSARSITSLLQESTETTKNLATSTKKDVQRMSNSVQEQIEQLFTDVAKDATSSFTVIYLGSLPLKDKVTSLQGLQPPLRELYLKELNTKEKCFGFLEICTTGLRVKINANYNTNTQSEENITPFHNIAVWSAVKFVVSDSDGGAAFLPLITDPDNIDKTSLFRPLDGNEKNHVPNNGHSPIFAVVMRAPGLPKVLKCHAFICKSTEDAIVIAATLYQSLMAHVNSSSHRSTKRRTPRNQNGVSCISIASSSARTGSNYLSQSHALSNGRKSSLRSSSESMSAEIATPPRSGRKKRFSNSFLTSSNNVINETETTTEERRRKSQKSKRAPPVPNGLHSNNSVRNIGNQAAIALKDAFCEGCGGGGFLSVAGSLDGNSNSVLRNDNNGDILTRVAIPRSGSFLNTGGLTRYKSRAARRHSGKLGGGGGSPLGFSELFNEFRLHENLHSLDEILYAIIDADGMSFNDLKPIYKEFLMKLAVTLTKDELFQRSKNIMRRQRKKKFKQRSNAPVTQKKSKTFMFGTRSLKKVLHLGQFRSCRGKPMSKFPPNKKEVSKSRMHAVKPSVTGQSNDHQRMRVATSGSDVSVVRKDNTLRGLNRNSSSGYVSCSECSYDSESCTCTSADRCYCSLRTDHVDSRLRHKSERNIITSNNTTSISRRNTNNSSGGNINRDSLISCKSDEKCYCSLVEEKSALPVCDFTNINSDTTWCDTDSCVSTSKCYCQRSQRDRQQRSIRGDTSTPFSHKGSTKSQTAAEKLALDYELFTISSNGKSVQPHEALSVKKSVEAAAIFADMKLSQTTDIKSMCPPPSIKSKTSLSVRSARSEEAKRFVQSVKKRDSSSIDRRHKHHSTGVLSSSSSQKSHSAEDLLGKLRAMEKNSKSESLKSARGKGQTLLTEFKKHGKLHCNYQSMRAVNASLEDTLGYLP